MTNMEIYDSFLKGTSSTTFNQLPTPKGNLEEYFYKLCAFKVNNYVNNGVIMTENGEFITKSAYDTLPDTKLTNGVMYYID